MNFTVWRRGAVFGEEGEGEEEEEGKGGDSC